MIYESAKYPMQCFWFTTLVSKQSHFQQYSIEQGQCCCSKTIDMAQGQKTIVDLLSENKTVEV
jgi:23S rRNA (adenine1618-N6)-methyltransferase